MNTITIAGFAKFIKPGDRLTTFKLSISRGKRSERDQQPRFLIPVKVFGYIEIPDSAYVCVAGKVDGHRSNEKDIIEILCDQ